jgi:hypothetical protein
MDTLTLWLVGLMTTWVPPAADGDLDRYVTIAKDVVTTAKEAPLFSDDADGAKTAIYLAAIGSYESSFQGPVDAFVKRGDHGRAWGLLQVHLLPGERCDTRLDCLRIGRERIRLSLRLCKRLPVEERLSHFMTGRCQTNADSRYRLHRADHAWAVAKAHRATKNQTRTTDAGTGLELRRTVSDGTLVTTPL